MKRGKRTKSDPYAVLMGVAHDLEMEGIDADTITDALFVAAVHGALVIAGRDAVVLNLRDMAARVAGEGLDAPPTAH